MGDAFPERKFAARTLSEVGELPLSKVGYLHPQVKCVQHQVPRLWLCSITRTRHRILRVNFGMKLSHAAAEHWHKKRKIPNVGLNLFSQFSFRFPPGTLKDYNQELYSLVGLRHTRQRLAV